MKILAIDTAATALSVAVVDDSRLLAETTVANGLTHSINLMGVIDQVLKWSDLGVADLDGLAVTNGPGSFTGLRIGISCIKGLAEAHNLPVVAVSSLTALAHQAALMALVVCPVLDARKKEIYYAIFRTEAGHLKQTSKAQVCPVSQLIEAIDEKCLFVGDGSILYRNQLENGLGALAHFAMSETDMRRGATVATLGLEGFKNGASMDAADLKPLYIRRADAKLKSGAIGPGREKEALRHKLRVI
jgi:tRNA threonylcarbamoyladenosine biosynthesis protein TsaB